VDDRGGFWALAHEYLNLLGCRGEICGRSEALGKLREAAGACDPFRVALVDMSPPEPEIFALSPGDRERSGDRGDGPGLLYRIADSRGKQAPGVRLRAA